MNKRKQSIYLPTTSMQVSDHRCGQQMNVVPSLSLSLTRRPFGARRYNFYMFFLVKSHEASDALWA